LTLLTRKGTSRPPKGFFTGHGYRKMSVTPRTDTCFYKVNTPAHKKLPIWIGARGGKKERLGTACHHMGHIKTGYRARIHSKRLSDHWDSPRFRRTGHGTEDGINSLAQKRASLASGGEARSKHPQEATQWSSQVSCNIWGSVKKPKADFIRGTLQ